MDEIIRHLWIGNMGDGRDAGQDFHVLCVMWKNEEGVPARAHQIETTGYGTAISDFNVWVASWVLLAAHLWVVG